MAKYDWTPNEAMDLDDGTHTCYFYRRLYHEIHLTQLKNDTWDVVLLDRQTGIFSIEAHCKTLRSAKAWASRYL